MKINYDEAEILDHKVIWLSGNWGVREAGALRMKPTRCCDKPANVDTQLWRQAVVKEFARLAAAWTPNYRGQQSR